jgi:hypothetical protein
MYRIDKRRKFLSGRALFTDKNSIEHIDNRRYYSTREVVYSAKGMMATSTPNYYKKRLEGVKATTELVDLLRRAHSKAMLMQKNKDIDVSVEEAVSLIIDSKSFLNGSKNDCGFLPIPLVSAMKAVFLWNEPSDGTAIVDELSGALHSSGLFFTPPPRSLLDDDDVDESTLTVEQIRWRRRMMRLRMKAEETKYARITKNLGIPLEDEDGDDRITTKSMTYAASIGLNMIVAPLSFGVFMYFFAGSILDYFWPPSEDHSAKHGNPSADIRRVMAGVVSGVLMMFVEMLLFVIRTHEFDRAMTQKKKKRQKIRTNTTTTRAFGHYTAASSRTYYDDRPNDSQKKQN